jgi:hypothetical protein
VQLELQAHTITYDLLVEMESCKLFDQKTLILALSLNSDLFFPIAVITIITHHIWQEVIFETSTDINKLKPLKSKTWTL